MNAFLEKPEVVAVTIPEHWKCPITGLVIPKRVPQNLQWRAKMLAMAEKDIGLRTDLYTASSKSLLFFTNAFAFTLRIFEAKDGSVRQAQSPHVPYVTWPIQDEHLTLLQTSIQTGESLMTDKSRDMGATWDHIIALTWNFLFREMQSFLMISRNENVLDVLDGLPSNYPFGTLSDPGTLFGKIDYLISRLPEWMIPPMSRKRLHLVNGANNSRIDGESSNAYAGSADRRTAIFLDEFAKVKEAENIKRSTKDVTACRLICSTPNGPGTVFSKWRMSNTVPLFEMPWWRHPEKAFGLYTGKDESGKWKFRSPWYDTRCEEDSPREIAIELDMDHVGSGDTFFEAQVIESNIKKYARPPVKKATIKFYAKLSDSDISRIANDRDPDWVEISFGRGKWLIWEKNLPDNRPNQHLNYVLGIDISKGQGASNSVISVGCKETKEKICEYSDPYIAPHELAKLAVAAAIWCGGAKRPLIIWENNGDPGYDFGRQIVHTYRYPNVYYDKAIGTSGEKVGKRYGWRSSPEKKASALGNLRRAYAHGGFVNPSEIALNECLSYVYYENGGIGPAALVQESSEARKAHGDRVIADMLLLLGMTGPKISRAEAEPLPAQCMQRRFDAFKKAKKRLDEESRNRFVFA